MDWRGWSVLVVMVWLISTGCAGCGSEMAGPGEACDSSVEQPCESSEYEVECVADEDGTDRCLHPTGSECDAEANEPLCPPDTTCTEDGEGTERCLIHEAAGCDPEDDLCAEGLVCEQLEDSDEHACHRQVSVEGQVFDAQTEDPVEDAHLVAFGEDWSALSDIAVTNENGRYEMELPTVRTEEGEPAEQHIRLRATAHNYQTFPGGIREAQPIDVADSVDEQDDRWVIDTAQTDVALIELPENERGNPAIEGTVDVDGGLGGVLVVAQPEDEDFEQHDRPLGFGAVSGLDGTFTIFNVPQGDWEVRGYLAGYQLAPEQVTVDDEDVEDVVIDRSDEDTTTVSGQIQIVDAPGDSETSVVLMVASTFDEFTVRGEVPTGLRADRVDGHWEIEDVPAGQYVVMAGAENDGLVRSPDEGMAGTDIVYTEIEPGGDHAEVEDSFKVTEALETVQPGAERPEELSERPTLIWGPDSQADEYEVVVFDAFGDIVFQEDGIDPVVGQGDIELDYPEDAEFEEGMYYQFRATSFHQGTETSLTEFLRGVFYRE